MSMFPKLKIRDRLKVLFAVCEHCSVVRAFHEKKHSQFPDTGFWLYCPVCREYHNFFRVADGRVVDKRKK